MPYRSEWPKKTSILPECCDFNTSLSKKLILICIIRGIYLATYFCLCVALLATDNFPAGSETLLILIATLNGIHLLTLILFAYQCRSGNHETLKRWLFVDIGISAITAITIVALICTVELDKVSLFLAIKCIALGVWFCFRNWIYYLAIIEQPPMQNVIF